MGFLRIKCHSCDKSWDIHPHMMGEKLALMCPRCLKQIDDQTWKNQLFPAWGAMSDANMEMVKDHTQMKQPLFEADYIADLTTRREN